MALPKEVQSYLAKGIPSPKQAYGSNGGGSQMLQNGLRAAGMTTSTSRPSTAPQRRSQGSQTARDGAYRKAVLDVLYTLSTTGQLPPEALQALMGG